MAPGLTYAIGLLDLDGIYFLWAHGVGDTYAGGSGFLCFPDCSFDKGFDYGSTTYFTPPLEAGAITLSPLFAVNDVGTTHTVTAHVTDNFTGAPLPGTAVRFGFMSGSNLGMPGTTGSDITNASGDASFTHLGVNPSLPGDPDIIFASVPAPAGHPFPVLISNTVIKEWRAPLPDFDGDGDPDATDPEPFGQHADPTFSLAPDAPAVVCICTPPMMNNQGGELQMPGSNVHDWYVKDDGTPGLSVEFTLSTVNLVEAGYHEIEVFDSSESSVAGPVELQYYSNINPRPTPGTPDPSTVLNIASAGTGDIYRVQLTVRGDAANPPVIINGPDGPHETPGVEVVARHYYLKFNGAIEAGMGSPSLRQIEAAPATWFLNVGAGESPEVRVASTGLIAPAETATIELRDPSGTLAASANLSGGPFDELLAAPSLTTAGQWSLTISGLDHHYRVDKLSGGDRGIYVTWLSFGAGVISVELTDDVGGPFTGVVDLTVTRTGPGPASSTSYPGVNGPFFQTPPLPPGFYSVTVTPPAGFTVGPAATLDVIVGCQKTAVVIFHLIPPGGEEPTTTRTQGFWSTHFDVAKATWLAVPNDARKVLGSRDMTNHPGVLREVMGGFWSDISKISTGKGKTARRSSLDQARMKLAQQYLAAVLNVQAFGTDDGGVIADGKAAFEGSDRGAMIDAAAALTAFNEGGDEEPLPDGFDPGSADPKRAQRVADPAFWDVLP